MAGVLTDEYFDQKQQSIDIQIHRLDGLLEEAYEKVNEISQMKAGEFLVELKNFNSEKRDLEVRLEQASDFGAKAKINDLLTQMEIWTKLNAARILRMEKTVETVK